MHHLLCKVCLWMSRYTKISERFLRFLIVGAFNTVFAYSLYSLFIFIGLHYSLAVLFSTIIGICMSFKTLGTLVFENPNNRLIWKFLIVYGLGYLLNILFLRLFVMIGFTNLYIDGFISCFLVAMINFFLNKYVVFRN